MTKSRQRTTSNFDQTSTPIEPQEFVHLGNRIREILEGNLDRGLPEGFTERGLEGINRAFGATRTSIGNTLSSRGLGTSPAGARLEGEAELARIGQSGSFLASIPALEQQARDRALAQSIAFFATRPLGQRSSGSSQSETVFTPSPLSTALGIASLGAGFFSGGFGGFGGLAGGGGGGGGGAFSIAPPAPSQFGFNTLNPYRPQFFNGQNLFGG